MIIIRREFIYPDILLAVGLIGYFVAQIEPDQVASLIIFTALISGTLLFWRFRLAFALAGIAALMIFGLMTTETFIVFAGLGIILFLVGMMMIVIGYLEDRHFFEYLLEKILKGVGNDPRKLVVILMLVSAMFAALVDEVTSILFMTATVLHLTSKLKINPIPFVMM